MISHIEGRVAEKRAGKLVIDVGGVGFLLLCPASTVAAAPAAGAVFRCYTHFSVYEGGMDLYGFSTREERGMFRRLCSVRGVGPRTALGVLSTLSLRDLSLAILAGDAVAIARAPNVGKKTAQRIILELKEKVDGADAAFGGVAAPPALNPDATQEAVEALLALGYSGQEAARAVEAVRDKAETADKLILLALKGLGG